MKYELISREGCHYDSVVGTSFKKARKYFYLRWAGKFIIIDEHDIKRNVIL